MYVFISTQPCVSGGGGEEKCHAKRDAVLLRELQSIIYFLWSCVCAACCLPAHLLFKRFSFKKNKGDFIIGKVIGRFFFFLSLQQKRRRRGVYLNLSDFSCWAFLYRTTPF